MTTSKIPVRKRFKPGDLVEVAVTLPLWQTLTYRLPEELTDAAQVGVPVLVPVGRRRALGYLLGPARQVPDTAIKDIAALTDPSPRFSAEIIPFFRWLAESYQHPIGEVFKTAVPDFPANQKMSMERWVSLSPGVTQATGQLGPKARSIIAFFSNNR